MFLLASSPRYFLGMVAPVSLIHLTCDCWCNSPMSLDVLACYLFGSSARFSSFVIIFVVPTGQASSA